MTPPNWDHVDHDLTRKVLTGEDTEPLSIVCAIMFANKCNVADVVDEVVEFKILRLRAEACYDAFMAYTNDDHMAAIEALKVYWSI